MGDFFRKNRKMLIIATAMIILLPIMVLTPSKNGFISREIGIAVVGYGGSIIGGFLTLYGVWWTIDDNKKSRREDLERQYSPFLLAKICSANDSYGGLSSEVIVLHEHYGFNDSEIIWSPNIIKLTNVGRGEIRHILIKLAKCEIVGTNPSFLSNEINISSTYVLFGDKCDIVPIGGEFNIMVGVPEIHAEFFESINLNYYERLSVVLDIIVQGVFTTKEQTYRLTLYVEAHSSKCEYACEISDFRIEMV